MRNLLTFLAIGSLCSIVYNTSAFAQTRAEKVGSDSEQKVGTVFQAESADTEEADTETPSAPSLSASPSPSPSPSQVPAGMVGSPVVQPVGGETQAGENQAAQPSAASGGSGMMPAMMSPMLGQPFNSGGRRMRGSYVCFDNGNSPCQCANVGKIAEAIKEAQEFHALCVSQGVLRSPNRLMAINDYRDRVGCMYLIDVQTGQCDYATTSDYGTGSGVPPRPGCRSGSHMTPAGFHVTRPHNGERYDSSNSLGLASLQGQGSSGRAILIHQGNCGGGAATWGCSGVGNYPEVRKRLGSQGALVYNYFGDEVGNCSGVRNKKTCRSDSSVIRSREGESGSDSGFDRESVK